LIIWTESEAGLAGSAPMPMKQKLKNFFLLLLSETPTKKELMKLLYKKVADKWRAMGDFLEIPAGQLNIIAEKNGSDPQKCLLHLWDIWLARTEPLPTWSAMADAVDIVSDDPSLVEKVRRMQDN